MRIALVLFAMAGCHPFLRKPGAGESIEKRCAYQCESDDFMYQAVLIEGGKPVCYCTLVKADQGTPR